MKTGIQALLRRYMRRYGEPPREHVAGTVERVWETLEPHAASAAPITVAPPIASASRRKPLNALAAAAAGLIVAAAVGTVMLWRPADNTLYRVAEGDAHATGDTIRSNGGGGAVLALADGSRVEMRSPTELALERASDGMRIRLHRGGIIVNALNQRTGHLYVTTKDMTVSVVGTVFMVNAEEEGSRVAVIEGEVRVRQGVTEKNLLPGDQVATSPAMAPASITVEIAWSRNAQQLRELLQQSAVPPIQPGAVSAQTPPMLENVSIRLAASGSVGGRGAAGARPSGPSCSGTDLQVDPSRFAVRNIPLYGLITLAYGKECQPQVQHIGGPEWVRRDGYDVQANIPAGTPAYTTRQLRNGTAPGLALMLQAMLTDRFKLVLGREMREMSVYNLVVVAPGKMKASADQNPPERVPVAGTIPTFTPLVGVVGPRFTLTSSPMSMLTGLLQTLADRPVIDRTELTGLFDVFLNFPALDGLSGAELEAGLRDQLSSRLQDQLGLKLEPTRALVEVLVIERAERPTEN